MPDHIKNIFIPHIHEDDEGLGKLKGSSIRSRFAAAGFINYI